MSQPAIEVRELGKKFDLGAINASTLREQVTEVAKKWVGKGSGDEEEFWALRDVSFEVQPGEVVGIIGRNGAGKSTLLKILSRITPPTEGEAIVRGRLASLLEVGTGFHPELTGRENVFLNGSILGMKRQEVHALFDEIVDFAGIEKFVDTPVKRYSSGMYVRLAFAVAAHIQPEILVIDEVLAVGDYEFQKKCLGKMGEFASQGRTVLFVSHNMGAISSLCTRGILLDAGKVVCDSDIGTVIKAYTQKSDGVSATYQAEEPNGSSGQIQSIEISGSESGPGASFEISETVAVKVQFKVSEPIQNFTLQMVLRRNEVPVFQTFHSDKQDALGDMEPGMYEAECVIPAWHIKAGACNLSFYLTSFRRNIIEHLPEIVHFEYTALRSNTDHKGYNARKFGQVIFPGQWTTKRISS